VKNKMRTHIYRILAVLIVIAVIAAAAIGYLTTTFKPQTPPLTPTITPSPTSTLSPITSSSPPTTSTHIPETVPTTTTPIYTPMLIPIPSVSVEKPMPKEFRVWVWILNSSSYRVRNMLLNNSLIVDVASPLWYASTNGSDILVLKESGAEDLGFIEFVRDLGIQLIPSIQLRGEPLTYDSIRSLSESLVSIAKRYRYKGYNIVLESISEFRNLTNVLVLLNITARRLHEEGLLLAITVPILKSPAEEMSLFEFVANSYIDYLIIMPFHVNPMPKPIAPIRWVEECLSTAVKYVPREKLVLGVPNYGIACGYTGDCRLIYYTEFEEIANRSSSSGLDEENQELAAYYESGFARYVDGARAYLRAELAFRYGLAGIAVWVLDYSEHSLYKMLRDSRLIRVLLEESPDYPLAEWIPAYEGNFRAGNRTNIRWVVVHVIQGTATSAINWFRDPRAKVSAHYIVDFGGKVYQLVREKDVAWHAGNRYYNEYSIGIEHEGFVEVKLFTESQYLMSARLTAYILLKYGLEPVHPMGIAPPDPLSSSGVIGHDQVPDPYNPAVGGGASHHTDPGSNWDWEKYMNYVKTYYTALRNRYADNAEIFVWFGVYHDRWSSDHETWLRQIDEAFKVLRDAGVTAVFFLAKDPWGYVYYNSSYAPLNPKYSWDPLRDIIEVAKKYGIKVYVYINALSEGETEPNTYLRNNPGLALRDDKGVMLGWVDPWCDSYVDRLSNIVREIVAKYPEIKGVQLDRIRAPQTNVFGECSAKKFRELYGIEPQQDVSKYQEFLAQGITEIVRRIGSLVKELNPELEFSAAVFPSPEAKKQVLQDWPTWVRDGLVDYVVTMTYTRNFDTFKSYVEAQLDAVKDPSKLVVGVGAWQLDKAQFAVQLSYLLELKGFRRICIFNLNALVDQGLAEVIKALKQKP